MTEGPHERIEEEKAIALQNKNKTHMSEYLSGLRGNFFVCFEC